MNRKKTKTAVSIPFSVSSQGILSKLDNVLTLSKNLIKSTIVFERFIYNLISNIIVVVHSPDSLKKES